MLSKVTGAATGAQVGYWPPDFNDSGKVDLTDVILLKPHFNGVCPAAAYSQRFDLNADGFLSLTHVILLKPSFNQQCTFVKQQ